MSAPPNGYSRQLGTVYQDRPKHVLAAIAVSALTVGGDYLEQAQARVVAEWDVLHANGIVAQPVPARHRHLIAQAEESPGYDVGG